jgi:hypothetical protein
MESTSTLEVLTRIATALERMVSPHTPLPISFSSLNSLNSSEEVKKEKESDGLRVQREGKPTRRRTPKTHYPENFEFDERAKLLAESLKLNPYKELALFHDKALANDYMYRDWQAAFRNWLRATNQFRLGGK